MHKFIYNNIYRGPADMPGGGTGGQPQNGAQQAPGGTQGGVQPPPEKKTPEQMMADFAELWNPPKPKDPAGGGNQQQQQQQPPAPGDKLGDFIKSQKYFDGVDPHKFGEALRSGDSEQVMPMMQQMFSNFHQIMLANMDKFGQHYYKKAKDEAVSEVGSSYQMDRVFDSMFTQKPELKLPAVAPMAKATVKQFMLKGESQESAVKKTIEFFDAMGGNLSKPPPNIGGNPGGAPSGYSQGPDGSRTAIDYEALWAQPQ